MNDALVGFFWFLVMLAVGFILGPIIMVSAISKRPKDE